MTAPRPQASREPLDAATLMRERIMLGLRMVGGVDLDDAAAILGTVGWTEERERAASWLVERGRIVREGSRAARPAGGLALDGRHRRAALLKLVLASRPMS